MHTRDTFAIALLVLSISCFLTFAFGSSAAVWTSSSDAGTEKVCNGKGEEEQVLCEAAQMSEETIKQVIAEDETVRAEKNSNDPSTPEAKDVWTAAYKQWIAGDGSESGSGVPKGVKRALEEAKKRFGKNLSGNSAETANPGFAEIPDLDDDELAQITAAARVIGKAQVDTNEMKAALDTIETLCASGDNGRQLEATGGVPHLLRHAHHEEPEVAVFSIRALASCSQNNPHVFESAVNANGAIDVLLSIAVEKKDRLDLHAAVLRALVALSEASTAPQSFIEQEEEVVAILKRALAADVLNVEGKRCVIRAYALTEGCLRINGTHWKNVFINAGFDKMAKSALSSDNADIRESAARVLALLR